MVAKNAHRQDSDRSDRSGHGEAGAIAVSADELIQDWLTIQELTGAAEIARLRSGKRFRAKTWATSAPTL